MRYRLRPAGHLPNRLRQRRQPPEYRTRVSQCRHTAPPGQALAIRRFDSGVRTSGYTAERVLSLVAEAEGLDGGDIVICSEYGSVEITNSDDSQVRLQIRMEGFGEGSERPDSAARRVLQETELQAHLTAHQGRLMVRVWHPTLGFTTPGAQAAMVHVRLQVPDRGAWQIRTEAFHGIVAIRRLTLAGAALRGAVGTKFKGVSGFQGGTELDNVVLSGDVDIDNLVGLPGIRAPASADMANLAAPITIKAAVAAGGRLTATTGGDILISIQPAPELGVRALGQSNQGQVRVGIDGGEPTPAAPTSSYRIRQQLQSPGYHTRAKRLEVEATSSTGDVTIVSVPAAPLRRPGADDSSRQALSGNDTRGR